MCHAPVRVRFATTSLPALLLILCASEAPGQSTAIRLELDRERLGALIENRQGDRDPLISEVLTDALLVTIESERRDPGPAFPLYPLSLHAFRIVDETVVATHQSEPFRARSGRPFRPDEASLPDERFYGERLTTDARSFALADEAVTPTSALDDPLGHIVNCVFPDKPPDWAKRQGVYVIVLPADRRQWRSVAPFPMIVFTD